MKLFALDAIKFVRELIKQIGEDDLSGAAAELSYRFFLALFPFFIFLAAMGGFVADIFGVDNPTDQIMDLIGDSLPPDMASVMQGELRAVLEDQHPGLVSIGIIATIYAASSAVGTLMKTLNRIYEVRETRAFYRKIALALGLTLLGGIALIGSFVLVVLGQVYGMRLAEELGMEGSAALFFSLARWPLVVLALLVSIAFLYWAAPNVKLPFKWISPGAVFFITGWLVLTYLFGLYVANFGSYDDTYGTLGGVVILLVWFYLTAFLLFIGCEINAVLAKQAIPEKLPQRAEEGATTETIPDEKKEEQVAAPYPEPGLLGRAGPMLVGGLLALITWRPPARKARPASK